MNEVIIDDVNVTKCEFFQSEYLEDNSVFCEFCTLWYNACLNNPDCYFKQLQRAKAELERLKSRNKLYKKIIKENIEKANNNFMILTACIQGNLTVDEVKQYAKLKTKNDELKIKNKSIAKDYVDVFIDYQKYKQALEDIRGSCNTYAKTEDYVIDQTFNEFLENVFNRINEVLN